MTHYHTYNNSASNSFAFSGCGWLTPFHLGVVDMMCEKGIINEKSFFGGTSGGSLAALVATVGIKPRDALDILISLSQKKGILNNVDKELKTTLMSIISDDAIVSKCNGRLHVTITEFESGKGASFNGKVISEYENKQQLVDIVSASCFIPFYSARRFVTAIDGFEGDFLDGGVKFFIPPVGDIRVCPFPRGFTKDPNYPHITLPKGKYSLPRLAYWGLNPPEPKVLMDLFEDGRSAAEAFISKQTAKELNLENVYPDKHAGLGI